MEILKNLKEVVNELNSINNLDEYKKNNLKNFQNIIKKFEVEYGKIEQDNPEYIEEAKKIVRTILDVHPSLKVLINYIINKTSFWDDFNEQGKKLDKLIESMNKKIEKLEEMDKNIHNSDYDNLSREEIIDKLKEKMVKSTTIFDTGGIRPTNELGESWIGKVCFQNPDETFPKDLDGNNLTPLITIFLDKLPYVPKELENIKLITIFMNEDIWKNLNSWDLDKWFVFRTYDNLDNLVPCNYVSDKIKPFPLVPHFKNDDYPMHDDHDDHDDDMIEFINDLEDNKGIDYYNDIAVNTYPEHKIGGHPASIQGGVGFDNDCKFVLQICSDEKADFNIVDSGNFYFGYNPDTKVWCVRCDFY